MEEIIKSEGKCLFCEKTFTKAGINRHLAKHLTDKTTEGVAGKSFFVKVETTKRWGSTPYFLSLWIDGEAKMKDMDNFLRQIWLECCGHLSAFSYPVKRGRGFGMNIFNPFDMEDEDEISMNKKVKTVLYKDLALEYEYDFGTTTKLGITVVGEYPVKADKKIVLLSRNEPLEIICSICGKAPATQICTSCSYREEAMYCDKCAKKHAKKCDDFYDYASMPVVNSPRMGECGYEGGTIDVERDGVYKM